MAQMKQPVAPYDPVKSVVGMWNGTITRLGYFFKDPVNYGAPTKAVLNSTSRRYQDALDDCEIQILEAKWYLEHQLKLNKEKREAAQAEKEDASSSKRKLAEFQERQTQNGEVVNLEEQPAKRQRVGQEATEAAAEQTKQKTPEQPKAPEVSLFEDSKGKISKKQDKQAQEPTQPPPASTTSESAQPRASPEKPIPPRVKTSGPNESRPTTSNGGREPSSQSGQNSPATAEEFNFESMFADPSGDANDAAGMNFDNMDLTNSDHIGENGMDSGGFDDANAFDLGDTSLNNLLPGLQSYAKQNGEQGDGAGGFDFGNGGDAGGPVGNEFALPQLGSSTFDDFLNDNTFGEGGGDGGDDFLKDGDMMNLEDLDASFFDAA